MLTKIVELIIAAVLGGLITMAISWLMLHGKIQGLSIRVKDLGTEFNTCHQEHLDCPDRIKDECQESIRTLAMVVDDLTKTTSLISSSLDAHLRISQQLDSATEQRFARIEIQLTRIENKLDQLKGWKIVQE
jgi:hypothetical protein